MMFSGGDTVLQVDRVSKIYSRQRAVSQQRLGTDLRRVVFGRSYDEASGDLRPGEFYAVKDVSFSLKRGEAFGVIGLNGSGKTTLLRMLAGQLLPDRGQISVAGRTASMIDLAAGFQSNASGRENVFLRGAALGRSREQMEADYAGIVEFAELGDAIQAPVATYSSGMTMRLAFSIVSNTSPDLLFIDEVLAVGDFRFRQKCLARVRELRERSAFVMVSHSMTDIMRFCDNAIVLNKGNVVFSGPSEQAVQFFESEIEKQPPPVAARTLKEVVGQFFENNDAISEVDGYWADRDGKKVTEISQNEPLFFHVRFKCAIETKSLIIGIPVWSEDGTYITGFSTDRSFRNLKRGSDGFVSVRLKIPSMQLNPNVYYSNLAIVDGSEFLWRKPNDAFRVTKKISPVWGATTLPYDWEYSDAQSEMLENIV